MMKFLLGIVLGIAIGAGGYWFFSRNGPPPVFQKTQQSLEKVTTNTISKAGQATSQLQKAFEAKLEALELQGETVKEELARAGKVVRRKARDVGAAVADAAVETQITATIKAKLAADPHLSVWNISVSTKGDVVTLAGTVSSPELISRAMLLALETKGVSKVVSTVHVK